MSAILFGATQMYQTVIHYNHLASVVVFYQYFFNKSLLLWNHSFGHYQTLSPTSLWYLLRLYRSSVKHDRQRLFLNHMDKVSHFYIFFKLYQKIKCELPSSRWVVIVRRLLVRVIVLGSKQVRFLAVLANTIMDRKTTQLMKCY